MGINEIIRSNRGLSEISSGTVQDQAVRTDREDEVIVDGKIIQLVSFTIEDVEYGIDILSVHDILRIPEITRLPNVPNFIKGVINLRGNVIPVVDVRKRFGFPEGEITDQSRIIVVETNDKLVGLMVDNVYQVVRIPSSYVNPPSDLIEGVSEEFIKGIGRLRDRLIIILTLTNVLFENDKYQLR